VGPVLVGLLEPLRVEKNPLSKTYVPLLLLALFGLEINGCSDVTGNCAKKDTFRRTELYDTKIAVNDTIDVLRVFESYKAHLALEHQPFPDGAEDWVYLSSSRFWADGTTQYWNIEYLRTDNQQTNTITSDDNGIVLWLEIIVHSPCI